MAFVIKEQKLPRWKQWLMALLGITGAGCSSMATQDLYMRGNVGDARPVMYVVDPSNRGGDVNSWPLMAERLPRVPVNLQRCVDHAAQGLKGYQGDRFRMLRLDTAGFNDAAMNQNVGSQFVANVQDGSGSWWGRNADGRAEYRRVHFHCLLAENGQVVYSHVRPE